MNSTLVRSLVAAGSLAVVFYLGLQLLRRTFDGRYMSYTTVDLETARADNLLLGQYKASCTDDDSEGVSAYVLRPTTKELGYALVGTRVVVPDAVTVIVETGGGDLMEQFGSVPNLEFDDGAGLFMGVDGGDKPIRPAAEIGPYGPNVSGCCASDRSRIPERFWLVDREGDRLCEFTFDEATRRDVPPQTRWTW